MHRDRTPSRSCVTSININNCRLDCHTTKSYPSLLLNRSTAGRLGVIELIVEIRYMLMSHRGVGCNAEISLAATLMRGNLARPDSLGEQTKSPQMQSEGWCCVWCDLCLSSLYRDRLNLSPPLEAAVEHPAHLCTNTHTNSFGAANLTFVLCPTANITV